MKIECIIRRPGGTNISFTETGTWPAGNYRFEPITSDPGAPHVADVDVEAHQQRLLSLPTSFRLYTTGTDGQAAQVTPPRTEPSNAATVGAAETVTSQLVSDIRALSVRDLKARINTFSPEALREALAIERSVTDDKPRSSWIAVVEAHLGAG